MGELERCEGTVEPATPDVGTPPLVRTLGYVPEFSLVQIHPCKIRPLHYKGQIPFPNGGLYMEASLPWNPLHKSHCQGMNV